MVTYQETYEKLLQQGVVIFEKLLELYAPDKQAERDWADISLMQTHNQYRSFTERLARTPARVSAGEAVTVSTSVHRYMDEHWADYQEFPKADPRKRALLVELHAQLDAVADGIGDIYNALREKQ